MEFYEWVLLKVFYLENRGWSKSEPIISNKLLLFFHTLHNSIILTRSLFVSPTIGNLERLEKRSSFLTFLPRKRWLENIKSNYLKNTLTCFANIAVNYFEKNFTRILLNWYNSEVLQKIQNFLSFLTRKECLEQIRSTYF